MFNQLYIIYHHIQMSRGKGDVKPLGVYESLLSICADIYSSSDNMGVWAGCKYKFT